MKSKQEVHETLTISLFSHFMHNPSSSHSISTFNPRCRRSDAVPLLSGDDVILLLWLLIAPDSATPADR